MSKAAWGMICALGLLAGCGGTAPPSARDPAATRGLWITRWDYRTAADVDRCLDDAARLGFTDVYWQVRGQADAFYRSELEPWGQELLAGDPGDPDAPLLADPGFDPLARAIRRARRHGLRLHAWINVYPLWRGLVPPVAADHLLHRRPGWRLHDERGEPQPLNDHYVVANAADPEVQAHVVAVARDLCARYPLDGLHLDYVRFVSDRLDPARLWPGDAASLGRWRAAGGLGDPRATDGRAAYRAWIRDEITRLVAQIAAAGRAERPDLQVSAAVVRRPDLARDTFLQDGARWLADGFVDRLLPMIYTRDPASFQADLAAWRAVAPADRLTPGLGVHLHAPADLPPQLTAAAGNAGFALFAYSALCESANPEQDKSPAARALRSQLQAMLEP